MIRSQSRNRLSNTTASEPVDLLVRRARLCLLRGCLSALCVVPEVAAQDDGSRPPTVGAPAPTEGAGGPATEGSPGCSPIDDCCEKWRNILAGGGGSNGLGIGATLNADGESAMWLNRLMADDGAEGLAACYLSYLIIAGSITEPLLEDYPGFVPIPGSSILGSVTSICDVQPAKMGCEMKTVTVQTHQLPSGAWATSTATKCVCSPIMPGGGGGGSGAAPATFGFHGQFVERRGDRAARATLIGTQRRTSHGLTGFRGVGSEALTGSPWRVRGSAA